jgi:hypothetical protein
MAMDPARDVLMPTAKEKGDLNWYRYCSNNPINMVDPLGLAELYINGTKVANPWGNSTDGYFGGIANLLSQMDKLGIVTKSNNWKPWNSNTKIAIYGINIGGDEEVTFVFNTMIHEASVEKWTTVRHLLYQTGYGKCVPIPGNEFLFNATTENIEINLDAIKLIFDGYGIKFDSWEIITSTMLSRSTNPKQLRDYIYNYLTNTMGVTKLQAVAILGNMYTETWHTFSPLVLEKSPALNEKYALTGYSTSDHKGWGLLQWTYPSRKQALLDYANAHPAELKTGDIDVQLGYFDHERKVICQSDWNRFTRNTTLDGMVESFCGDYEGGVKNLLQERKDKAKDYALEYGVSI